MMIGLANVLPAPQAGEIRQHKAHEHGTANLNVALDGNKLYLELTSPAANIVGFEHPPRTPEQKTAVKQAIKIFKAGDILFALPEGVEGRLVKASVNTEFSSSVAREVDEKQSQEHEEHQSGDEKEIHSEFKAEYRFLCKKPGKLAYLDVMLFRYFARIETIEVQLLTATRQTALELTAQNFRIDF